MAITLTDGELAIVAKAFDLAFKALASAIVQHGSAVVEEATKELLVMNDVLQTIREQSQTGAADRKQES